jgi:hypothetical protein
MELTMPKTGSHVARGLRTLWEFGITCVHQRFDAAGSEDIRTTGDKVLDLIYNDLDALRKQFSVAVIVLEGADRALAKKYRAIIDNEIERLLSEWRDLARELVGPEQEGRQQIERAGQQITAVKDAYARHFAGANGEEEKA